MGRLDGIVMSIEKAADEFDDHFRRAFFLQLADKLGPRISDDHKVIISAARKRRIQDAVNRKVMDTYRECLKKNPALGQVMGPPKNPDVL